VSGVDRRAFPLRRASGAWRVVLAVAGALLLGGCEDAPGSEPVLEEVRPAPLALWIEAQGELKAAKSTKLVVPGQDWAQRQLVWMAPDGSPVKSGDLVARFAAEQTQLELDKALLNLERNTLSQAAKRAELEVGGGRLDVDLAQVQSDLAIASRYAQADFEAIARNVVLDAIADERFLGEKREVLDWRKGQSEARGGAELQVLTAQRETVAMGVRSREDDLGALELRAPHDGVFVLATNWSGEKPQLGAQMWAGNDLATLPDSRALEVELSLPQIEAQVLALGQTVRLHPAGRPEQAFEAPISWLASAPRAVSRNSPVRHLAFKVTVPPELGARHGWVPGQAFQARVLLKTTDAALSVPNLAVQTENGQVLVRVWVDGEAQRRPVVLGVRGPARSEVLEGLAAGDRVVLAFDDSDAATDADAGTDDDADDEASR
jgi:hypothetical protein